MSEALSGFTVADLCRRWKVGASKVRGWLARGDLVGVNVAGTLCGKPQWRVTPEAVEAFERKRSSAPSPKPAKRRQLAVRDYYPDVA